MSVGGRRALIGLGVLIMVGGLAAYTGVELVRVARDLDTANDLVEDASEALTDGRLAEAMRSLDQAEGLVLASNQTLQRSAGAGLLRMVPGARQNLRSIEESVRLAAVVVHGGRRILDVSAPLESEDGTLEVGLESGAIPLGAVTDAQREIAHLLAQLVTVRDDGNPWYLLSPVQSARSTVIAETVQRREHLQVLGRGLELLRVLAGGDGPRTFVIAVANTAEMRGSGGMILSYGLLDGADGGFDLREFGRIDEIQPTRPVPDEQSGLPEDYLRRWDGFDPTLRWRNATMAADFALTSPLLLELYEQATNEPAHGVIQIDPQGLAAILEGVGPVLVPELGIIDADNVVDVVLNEAYARFPDIDDRTDVLGDIAEAAFERLVEGDYPSIRGLAEALVEAVDGGHIRMQARSAAVNAQLEFFGAAGTLPDPDEEHVALTVQNASGNKLDYYLDTALRVEGSRPSGALGSLRVEIRVANGAPPGVTEPRYVFGPNIPGQEAGLYRGVVSLYLPVGSSLAGSSGGPVRDAVDLFTEDGRPVVSYTVDLPAGSTSTVVLDLDLAPRPHGPYELIAVSSPRVRPTTLQVDIDTEGESVSGQVSLDRTWKFSTGRPPTAAR